MNFFFGSLFLGFFLPLSFLDNLSRECCFPPPIAARHWSSFAFRSAVVHKRDFFYTRAPKSPQMGIRVLLFFIVQGRLVLVSLLALSSPVRTGRSRTYTCRRLSAFCKPTSCLSRPGFTIVPAFMPIDIFFYTPGISLQCSLSPRFMLAV